MNLADELQKLERLHRAGSLSDEEFAQAKSALLNPPPIIGSIKASNGEVWKYPLSLSLVK